MLCLQSQLLSYTLHLEESRRGFSSAWSGVVRHDTVQCSVQYSGAVHTQRSAANLLELTKVGQQM